MSLKEIVENRIKYYENKVDEYIDINKPDYPANTLSREYYRGKWDAYKEIQMMLK